MVPRSPLGENCEVGFRGFLFSVSLRFPSIGPLDIALVVRPPIAKDLVTKAPVARNLQGPRRRGTHHFCRSDRNQRATVARKSGQAAWIRSGVGQKGLVEVQDPWIGEW